jgi:FeS assembly protein IscX
VADPLYWDDAYPIALLLKKAHPDVEPTTVPQDQLRDWVLALDGFVDDASQQPEQSLEHILSEWVELCLMI